MSLGRRELLKAIVAGAAALKMGVGPILAKALTKPVAPKPVPFEPAFYAEPVRIYWDDKQLLNDDAKLFALVEAKIQQAHKRLQKKMLDDGMFAQTEPIVDGPFELQPAGIQGEVYYVKCVGVPETHWRNDGHS